MAAIFGYDLATPCTLRTGFHITISGTAGPHVWSIIAQLSEIELIHMDYLSYVAEPYFIKILSVQLVSI